MLVSTLVGETKPDILDENTNFDIIDGPWGNCGGLEKMEWLVLILITKIVCMCVEEENTSNC